MPAITACLIVSLLDISIAMRGVDAVARGRSPPSRLRVPEPRSRTMNGAVGEVSDRHAAPGAQQRMVWRRDEDERVRARTARLRVAISLRRPAHDREVDLARVQQHEQLLAVAAHLQPDVDAADARRGSCASSRGTKYLAVLTSADVEQAALQTLRKRAIASSASFSVASSRLA